MEYARAHGYPVPAVEEISEIAPATNASRLAADEPAAFAKALRTESATVNPGELELHASVYVRFTLLA